MFNKVKCRISKYRESFYPEFLRSGNNTNNDIRNCGTPISLICLIPVGIKHIFQIAVGLVYPCKPCG